MIKDKIENIKRYDINKEFEALKDYLLDKKKSQESVPASIKMIPLDYQTKVFDLSKFENHQLNIDVHYILQGRERIALSTLNHLTAITDYSEKDDFQLFRGEILNEIILESGEFLLLFPGEVHATGGLVANESEHVKKQVFKIPLDSKNI